MASPTREAARYHGDQAALPGLLDFAVNVRSGAPPAWLTERLAVRLPELGRYPSAADERRAVAAVAARHGRHESDVALPDVLVLRSLTKTWALAGLRVGYALGAPEVLARLTARRAHWPLGTLQLEAIAATSTPAAVGEAEAGARRLAALRAVGLDVVAGAGPFVLFGVPDVELVRKHLESKGIAVRRCDTFVGLPDNYLRATVRAEWPVLVDAVTEVLR